jgi:uncharacterized membrane protein SpoIIM required for sporulation
MNLERFLQQRTPNWQALETLLVAARRPDRLSEEEIATLGRLYRLATAGLALAQREFPRQTVTVYLNQLVGRAHAAIYRGDVLRRRRLVDFYRRDYPQLYRGLLPYTAVAFLLLMGTWVVAFLVVWRDPALIYMLLGPEIAPLVHEVEQGELWTDIAPAVRSAASALILTNNIQVTFLTFAGGITAGLLTVYILINNGLQLGAIFGLLQAHGLSAGLAEFVVAHGFIELSVIFLAGGCGLYLGDGLLRPGLLSRSAALVQRAGIGVRLIFGSAPLLVVAGLIEGFISPSGLPWTIKLAVGLATGILLHLYWLRAGRSPQPESPSHLGNVMNRLPTSSST